MRKHTIEQLERRQLLAVITNGGAPQTIDYLSVDVGPGGSISPGNTFFNAYPNSVLYHYQALLDVATPGAAGAADVHTMYDLGTSAGAEYKVDNNTVQSSGRIDIDTATGSYIDFIATTTLQPNTFDIDTRYSFTAVNYDLTKARLFQMNHPDGTVIGDEVFVVKGSIAGGDLSVDAIEPPTYIWWRQQNGSGNVRAALSGYAVDTFGPLAALINAGGYVAPQTGYVNPTNLPPIYVPFIGTANGTGDVNTALQYDFLSPASAVVSTRLNLYAAQDVPLMRVYGLDYQTGQINLINDDSTARLGTTGTDFDLGPLAHQFLIRNVGGRDMLLTGQPTITLSGPNAGSFRVIRNPMSRLGSGADTEFAIVYSPNQGGQQWADVTITSNDLSTTAYTFRVFGGSGAMPSLDAYEDDGPTVDPVLVNENFNATVVGGKPAYWKSSNGARSSTGVQKFVSKTDKQLRLKDSSTTGSASLFRTFASTSSVLDATFRFNTAINGSSFQLRSGSAVAVDLYVRVDENGVRNLAYRDAEGTEITVGEVLSNTWYTIKMVADPATDTFNLFVNDEQIVSEGAFRTPVDGINQIRFATDRVAKGILYIDDVKVSSFQAVRDQARTISTQGVGQVHSLHAGTDTDWVQFELGDTSNVVIETFAPVGDTRVYLYDAAGNRLAYDNDSGPGRSAKIGNENEFGRGALTLGPGTYYVRVDETGHNALVPLYMLYVRAGDVAAAAPAAIDAKGKLHIAGTSEDDTITVDMFQTSLRVVRNSNTWYFPISEVSGIEIDGGSGNDTIYVGAGVRSATIRGGSGDDAITDASSSPAFITGDDGNDAITSGDGKDTIDGGAGNDNIDGKGGDDRLLGGDGDDLIFGGDGNDEILAGVGNDTVHGGAGNDSIVGDAGDDSLFGDEGNDRLFGDAGRDYVNAGPGTDQVTTWQDGEVDTVVATQPPDVLFVDGSDVMQ